MCHDKNIVYVVLGHPIHMGIFAMDIYIYIHKSALRLTTIPHYEQFSKCFEIGT